MIISFQDSETEKVFQREFSRKLPQDIQRSALRKLLMVHAANDLRDLIAPPSNHLESLHGDRNGQYSIRINDQWRICFEWSNGNASQVEITDYH